jgi:hypothetical protein
MNKYKKGNEILTQKDLKEAAKNKRCVWVEYSLPDPSDKFKEMNGAVIPEPTADNNGFYLGGTCWDNINDDSARCVSEGYDGDTLIIYDVVKKSKIIYSKDMTTEVLVKTFLNSLPEEIYEFIEENEVNKIIFKRELIRMIESISD